MFPKFLFVLALIFVFLTDGGEAYKKEICILKKKKCCYKFGSCGLIIKKKDFAVRCDYKVCKNVCKHVCKLVPVKKTKKVCAVKIIKKLIKKCYYDHGKYICKIVPIIIKKPFCIIKHVIVHEKVCKKVCEKVCKIVKAICKYEKKFKFIKFCPSLVCFKEVIIGPKAPGSFVSDKGIFVEKKFVKRVDLKH